MAREIKLILIILILSLITVLLLSKCNNHDSVLVTYFNGLDKAFSPNEKMQFKKCKDVGCLYFIRWDKDSEFRDEFYKIPNEVSNILDSIGITQALDRDLALLLAYHRETNNLDYSFVEIKKEILEFRKRDRLDADNRIIERNKKLTKIAQAKYDKFTIGDTLCLTFKVMPSGSNSIIVYYDFKGEDKYDTLFLK